MFRLHRADNLIAFKSSGVMNSYIFGSMTWPSFTSSSFPSADVSGTSCEKEREECQANEMYSTQSPRCFIVFSRWRDEPGQSSFFTLRRGPSSFNASFSFQNLTLHRTWINSRLLKSKSFTGLGCPPHSILPLAPIT